MSARGPDVLLRCDGGAALGLGHVKRCIALAVRLAGEHRLTVGFAGRFDRVAAELIAGQRFAIAAWPDGESEDGWLWRAARGVRAIVFDIRTDLPVDVLRGLGARGIALVTLDDGSDRRLAADVAFLPPTPAALALDWPYFRGEALIGWPWTVLASTNEARGATTRSGTPRLLVAMGGSDPAGLTLRAAQALRGLARAIQPIFVIGPAMADAEIVRSRILALWPDAEIAFRPDSLAPQIAASDLALVAYGVTAQELAAGGVPALYIALTDDHQASAEALARTGAGHALGLHDLLSDADLCSAVAALVEDRGAQHAMAAAGPKAIDGLGARRVAARIAELIRLRKRA